MYFKWCKITEILLKLGAKLSDIDRNESLLSKKRHYRFEKMDILLLKKLSLERST